MSSRDKQVSSHDNLWLRDTGPYGLVGQDLAAIDVDLVLDRHVLAQHTHVFHPHPLAHRAAASVWCVVCGV